jgi:hypothetical protein
MLLNKITLIAAALSMLSWMSTPVFAGHNPSHGNGHGHGHKAGTSEGSAKGNGHHGGTKTSHGHHQDASDNTHSNKGGAQRGLDRANQTAGSHGEEGRDNASAHHSSDADE